MSQLIGLLLAGFFIWLRFEADTHVPMPRRDRRQDWKSALDRCGFRTRGRASSQYPRITARAGPVEVKIDTVGSLGEDTRIVVRAPVAPDFERVKIHPQSVPPAQEVVIGDPGFDNAFSIEGPALQLFALLDAETRRRMRAVNATGRLEISRDRIMAVVSEDGWVSDVLPSLLEIARRLGTPPEIPRRLVENVKRDSEGGVRLQNLFVLLRELPGDPATAEALRAARSDWSPAVRLRVAKEMGAEGRETLQALAHGLEDDAVSGEAVSILDRELPAEQAKALLDRAAGAGRPRTAEACIQVLARGGAAGEALLIQALGHEAADVRVLAARALGRAGSAEAVLPLQEATERFRLDRELRRAARQAIAEIQSRAQGASPGQLSLAQTEAGQLSLAADPTGQLSLGGDGKRES